MPDQSITTIKSSLICPACSHRLTELDTGYVCTACKIRYTEIKGIPELISQDSKCKMAEAAYHSSISSFYRNLHQLNSYRNRFYHLQALKPILSLSPQSSVLELGCGTGYDAIPLLRHEHLVVETDIASGQVIEAKKQISQSGLSKRALFYIADAENLPFADEVFDATFIVASLHHLEHPTKALQEMGRCTKRRGNIIIAMEPNKGEWISIFAIPFAIAKSIVFHTVGRKRLQKALVRADKYREPTIERTFSRSEFVHMAGDAGLKVQRIRSVWFLCGFAHWFILLLNKLSTNQWTLNSDIEYFLVHIDHFLSHIPGINHLCCNWTLHCIK